MWLRERWAMARHHAAAVGNTEHSRQAMVQAPSTLKLTTMTCGAWRMNSPPLPRARVRFFSLTSNSDSPPIKSRLTQLRNAHVGRSASSYDVVELRGVSSSGTHVSANPAFPRARCLVNARCHGVAALQRSNIAGPPVRSGAGMTLTLLHENRRSYHACAPPFSPRSTTVSAAPCATAYARDAAARAHRPRVAPHRLLSYDGRNPSGP